MEWAERYTYLRDLNPLPGDPLVRFSEEGHRYQFRLSEDASWQDGVPVGDFIGVFAPEFPEFMVINVRNSLNSRYEYWRKANAYSGKHGVPYLDPRETVKMRPWSKPGVLWPEKYHAFLPPEVFRRIHDGDVETVRSEGWKVPHLDGGFTNEDVQQGWTREGTELHGRIEASLNHATPLPGRETTEWAYFQAFLRDHPTWVPFRTELNVALPEYGICGRIDAIFFDTQTGKYILIDWKCSKKLKAREEDDEDYETEDVLKGPFEGIPATTRNKFFIKKNVYRIGMKRSHELEIGSMYLLVLHRSNPGYVLIRIPICSETRNQEMHARIQSALKRFRDRREEEGGEEGEGRDAKRIRCDEDENVTS
jgi:hypothetical protein